MAYRPFYAAVAEVAPATFANPATVGPKTPQSVAVVATVAGPPLNQNPLRPRLVVARGTGERLPRARWHP